MDARQAAHPTDQTPHAYGAGKLDDVLAESVNSHLEDCPGRKIEIKELPSTCGTPHRGRLHNEEQNAFLTRLVSDHNMDSAWLGATDEGISRLHRLNRPINSIAVD
jgi:hypothetical protein